MGRKVSLTIDMDDLPKEQAEVLAEFLDDSDFFELPADLTKPAVPDSFTYNITVSQRAQRARQRYDGTG